MNRIWGREGSENICFICHLDLKLLFSYVFDYFLSPHMLVSLLVSYGEITQFFFLCCDDQRFLGRCPHYLPGLSSLIKNRCSPALTSLPLLPPSNKKQKQFSLWGPIPLWILWCWRTPQDIGKCLRLWLARGAACCRGLHTFCGLQMGNFGEVLQEFNLPCNFSLTGSKLWVRWSILYYLHMINFWKFLYMHGSMPLFLNQKRLSSSWFFIYSFGYYSYSGISFLKLDLLHDLREDGHMCVCAGEMASVLFVSQCGVCEQKQNFIQWLCLQTKLFMSWNINIYEGELNVKIQQKSPNHRYVQIH